MPQDPYKYFRIEARELLQGLARGALDLEKGAPGADHVPRLLRLAHTLKGAARVVKQREIGDLAHSMEDALSPFRDSGSRPTGESVARILELVDSMNSLLLELSTPSAPQPAAHAVHVEKGAPNQATPLTVRTELVELEALMQSLSEVRASAMSLQASSRDRSRALLALPEEFWATFSASDRSLSAATEQLNRDLDEAQERAERLRLSATDGLFTSLERTLRDSARTLGKQARFEARGAHVRLDARVLESVQKALVQLIRNAVAHGIEPQEERVAAGKAPVGHVVVEIRRRNRQVVFQCKDDGRGLDVEGIRTAALRGGASAATLANLRQPELIELLLKGGVSTSPTVTALSGRGIGLDLVRATAEELGGSVSLTTEIGKGSCFELVVPFALASFDGLALQASGITATIPLDSVRRTLRLQPQDVSRHAEGQSIVYDGQAIPFVALSAALGVDAPAALTAQACSAAVIEGSAGLVAIGCERLLGTTHTVLRPLPKLTPASPMIAGASLDPRGNPELVLDPDSLVRAARHALPPRIEAAPLRQRVLVVDDSLTTRMLEQSILQSAGYEVDLATSGEQAIEQLQQRLYDLLLVDVEMPGMDGFTFIEHVRRDPRLRDIPALLVSSRAAPQDRERARTVGAQGYIVKSEFDQVDLLARIKRLVA